MPFYCLRFSFIRLFFRLLASLGSFVRFWFLVRFTMVIRMRCGKLSLALALTCSSSGCFCNVVGAFDFDVFRHTVCGRVASLFVGGFCHKTLFARSPKNLYRTLYLCVLHLQRNRKITIIKNENYPNNFSFVALLLF